MQQLDDAVKRLNLRGAAVGGSVADTEFADPKFHPVWAKAQELGVLLFIHPAGVSALNKRLKGNGVLENVIGNPLDTTIALSQLIFQVHSIGFPASRFAQHTVAVTCRRMRTGRIMAVSRFRSDAIPTSSSRKGRPSISGSSISIL